MSKLVIPGVVAQTGSGGGGGGDVPQNSNPLDRLIAEDYITAYPFVDLDPDAEEPIVIYLPTFDIIEEAPDVAPRRFVGVLPADIAETEHDWEFEIVQYVAKEAWYHLIGTDMVFSVTQDVETFDWVTDDRIYPIEATLPGYSTSGKKLIVNDSTENVKWVTDNKLENTATGTDSIGILIDTNYQQRFAVGIGKGARLGYYGVTIGRAATSGENATAIGAGATATQYGVSVGYAASTGSGASRGIAIGYAANANATNAIQLGQATNSTASTFQVYSYPMLDGTTGKIPMARLPIVQISQADYDALVSGGTVDTNTLYLIV